jgi:hypothetical protein
MVSSACLAFREGCRNNSSASIESDHSRPLSGRPKSQPDNPAFIQESFAWLLNRGIRLTLLVRSALPAIIEERAKFAMDGEVPENILHWLAEDQRQLLLKEGLHRLNRL